MSWKPVLRRENKYIRENGAIAQVLPMSLKVVDFTAIDNGSPSHFLSSRKEEFEYCHEHAIEMSGQLGVTETRIDGIDNDFGSARIGFLRVLGQFLKIENLQKLGYHVWSQ